MKKVSRHFSKSTSRSAGAVLAVVAGVLLLVWGRAYHGSSEAYRQAEECLRERRYVQAVTYLDRAIHWYAPLNPYVGKSAQALWDLSETAEREGDFFLALAALTSLKSGYIAASGILHPGENWIKRCKERMDGLASRAAHENLPIRADHEIESGMSPNTSPPKLFWTLLLEAGLIGWVGWIIWLIVRRRKQDRTSFASILKWVCPLLFFYALWILGMVKA